MVFMVLFMAFTTSQAFSGASPGQTSPDDEAVLLAFGDSLFAGFGLAEQDAFPAVLEARLRRQGYPVRVINAGVSGDTTADGLDRLEWVLAGLPTDRKTLAILELGANDALRGVNPDITRRNLFSILEIFQERGISVFLAGMLAPLNLGRDFTTRFNAIFPDLAETFDLPLYPFFLEGVVGNPTLNLGDGIHPNEQGINVITDNILPLIADFLRRHGVQPVP
ncbi:arylesterase [Desulfonatronum sp. SC1]|nr:arylesterase [Desulfonatronum sp. SC1]